MWIWEEPKEKEVQVIKAEVGKETVHVFNIIDETVPGLKADFLTCPLSASLSPQTPVLKDSLSLGPRVEHCP